MMGSPFTGIVGPTMVRFARNLSHHSRHGEFTKDLPQREEQGLN